MSQQARTNSAALIWSVAEILRGDFKQSEYQKVVLPFTRHSAPDRERKPNEKDSRQWA